MNTIIVSILAFLLSIFSGCGMLQTPDQSMTFPGEAVVTDNIMAAIEEKDTAAIENMMSSKRQQNDKNLTKKIAELIDAIDGNVINYTMSGGYDSDKAAFGKRISLRSWGIEFSTATESYYLSISWTVVNNRAPEEVGMSDMSLLDSENNVLATTYVPKQ